MLYVVEESRVPRRQRIGAATGIIAPIFAFTCILSAIASYPPFNWTNNALSDLGVISGITGPIFNFGLYSCGALALIFTLLGLFAYLGKNWVGKLGAAVFAAATIALVCIGIFNENFSPTHYFASVAFFVLMPISLFIITAAFGMQRQTKMAVFTILIGIVAAIPWILFFVIHYVSGKAIPEFISGLAGAVWIITLGYKILEENKST
jgi:hypothetical membrane protein